MRVEKPWGYYEDIYRSEDKHTVFKKIVVQPGGQLSVQSHSGRNEFWVVTSGVAIIQIGEYIGKLTKGRTAFIHAGEKHSLANEGTEPLVVYEMQAGLDCDEDDIIRYSDKYGRETDETESDS